MTLVEKLRSELSGHVSRMTLESALSRHLADPRARVESMRLAEREALADRLLRTVTLFSAASPDTVRIAIRRSLELDGAPASVPATTTIPIRSDVDVNVARTEARRIAEASGTSALGSVKIATAVSELARNVVLYAGEGTIAIEVARDARGASLRIRASDEGPGIPEERLAKIAQGTYASRTGLGKGLAAVGRLADEMRIDSSVGKGTVIEVVFRGAR